MDRRDFVTTIGIATSSLLAVNAFGSDEHHNSHGKMGANLPPVAKKLVESISDCQMSGKICVGHCFDLISKGKQELVACLERVNSMLAVSAALQSVVAQNAGTATSIKTLAKACKAFCEECQAECDKHAKHHQACADCSAACKACIKACDDFVKA